MIVGGGFCLSKKSEFPSLQLSQHYITIFEQRLTEIWCLMTVLCLIRASDTLWFSNGAGNVNPWYNPNLVNIQTPEVQTIFFQTYWNSIIAGGDQQGQCDQRGNTQPPFEAIKSWCISANQEQVYRLLGYIWYPKNHVKAECYNFGLLQHSCELLFLFLT